MLPALSQLRLGDATGVTLSLVARPNGVEEDDVVTGTDRRTPQQARDEAVLVNQQTEQASNDSLETIIADLKTGSSRRNAWRLKVVETMERKIAKYQERIAKVQVDIDEERAKIEEFLEAAYEAPGSGRRALANANTDPWSVAKDVNDRWQTLRSERSTLDVVKRAAQAKKDQFNRAITNALIAPMATALASALEQLKNDYSTQPELLETMRQLFVSLPGRLGPSASRVPGPTTSSWAIRARARRAWREARRQGARRDGHLRVRATSQEVYRSDFVADYEGQTAGKTRRLLERQPREGHLPGRGVHAHHLGQAEGAAGADLVLGRGDGRAAHLLGEQRRVHVLHRRRVRKEMQNDFLKSNPGLTRRFTQQLWLKSYEAEELARIYLDELARNVSTEDNPYDREDIRQWFTTGAMEFLVQMLADREAVATDAEGNEVYRYPDLHELFSAQAGAMVTLAAETKLLLASSGKRNQLGENPGSRTFAIGPEDLKKVIESRFLKSFEDAEPAVEELLEVACSSGWLHAGKWKLASPEQLSKRVCAEDYEREVEGRRESKRRAVRPERLEPKSLAGPSTVNY